jgi:hypothetical protein
MKTATIEKVVVKEFHTHGHSYRICQDTDGGFWGFDLAKHTPDKEYNGITGHHGRTIIDTMRHCYQSARTENEIDREKLDNHDMDEMLKLLAIVEDSYKEIA